MMNWQNRDRVYQPQIDLQCYDPASVKFSYNLSPRSNSGLSNDDASETTLIHDIIHEIHEGNSHHPLSNNNVPIISSNGVDENNTEITKRGETTTTTTTTLHSFPEGITEGEESIMDNQERRNNNDTPFLSRGYGR